MYNHPNTCSVLTQCFLCCDAILCSFSIACLCKACTCSQLIYHITKHTIFFMYTKMNVIKLGGSNETKSLGILFDKNFYGVYFFLKSK